MRVISRLILLIAALAAAATTATATVGAANAAWSVEPGKFVHTQELANGVLTVNVTNTTGNAAGCPLSIYPGVDIGPAQEMAEAMNAYYAGTGTTAAVSAARAKFSASQFTDLLADVQIPADQTQVATWDSGRADTSYTVFQNCAASDNAGTVVWGAQAYLVSGTGAPTGMGSGSLGSLFTGS